MMKIFITEKGREDLIKKFMVEKTRLYHKAIEIVVVDEIPKNEAGKSIYNLT